MTTSTDDISARQSTYYGGLYERHGASVDAVASASQTFKDLRYQRLSNVFGQDHAFSVHDVGCGLAHLHAFLQHRYPDRSIEYSGSDITPKFVDHCRQHHPGLSFELRDLAASPFPEKYDYLVFGGTFYHLAGSQEAEFLNFLRCMLRNGFSCANKAIAFNLITSHVDYRLDDLFYAELGALTDFIAQDLSRFFTIDHSSPLYEYTVCVYQPDTIRRQHVQSEFDKYFKAR